MRVCRRMSTYNFISNQTSQDVGRFESASGGGIVTGGVTVMWGESDLCHL